MTKPSTVVVWDLFIRIVHWAVAALVLFNLFVDASRRLHRWAGYLAAALVIGRLLWGIAGPRGARISAWWPRVPATFTYLRGLLRRRPQRHLQHNPLGAWMAALLWLLIIALSMSGWLMGTDRFWGEAWLQTVHAWLADGLLVCVVIHLLGAVVMSIVHHENLPWSMITGRKKN